MIRHMVLFRFKVDVDLGNRRTVLDSLAQLPSLFPFMKRFGLGENISQRDRTFTHVMTIEFDSQEMLEGYLASAVHERFVSDIFKPAIEDRVIASYDWNDREGA